MKASRKYSNVNELKMKNRNFSKEKSEKKNDLASHIYENKLKKKENKSKKRII